MDRAGLVIEADHGSWTLGTTQGRCYRDSIRICEQHLFVRSTGFHHFAESFCYVSVPLPSSELLMAPVDAIRLPIRPTTIALIEEDCTDTDLDGLSAVERAEEPVAATVYIKGYDPPPPADEQRERELRFASLQIEELQRTVFLRKDHIAQHPVQTVADLREAFSKGWRLNRERPVDE